MDAQEDIPKDAPKRGQAERDALILAHLSLAKYMAFYFWKRPNFRYLPPSWVNIQDLQAEALKALVEAANNYDPAMAKFSTYAAKYVWGRLLLLASQASTIRIPKNYSCRNLTPATSAQMTLAMSPDSYDGDVDEVAAQEPQRPPEMAHRAREALSLLSLRLRSVIKMRFGFDGGKELTLEEAALRLRVSRERVRQLEEIALREIRAYIASDDETRQWNGRAIAASPRGAIPKKSGKRKMAS